MVAQSLLSSDCVELVTKKDSLHPFVMSWFHFLSSSSKLLKPHSCRHFSECRCSNKSARGRSSICSFTGALQLSAKCSNYVHPTKLFLQALSTWYTPSTELCRGAGSALVPCSGMLDTSGSSHRFILSHCSIVPRGTFWSVFHNGVICLAKLLKAVK